MTLRVTHGNVYVNNLTPSKALVALTAPFASGRVHSAGINEGQRIPALTKTLRGYRAHHADSGRMWRGYLDTQVLVRSDLENLGDLAFKISDEVPALSKVAPDRWVTAAAYQHNLGRVLHISFHPNAGPRQLQGEAETRLVREYAASVAAIEALLTFGKALGYKRVLTTDANYRQEWGDAPWNPFTMLARAGMEGEVFGLDGIFWSRNLEPVVVERFELTGSDHPGVRAAFK